tara:strand:- start:611 stop:778 length:168 start_codon:yes stop_codon:yes gene_type:complete
MIKERPKKVVGRYEVLLTEAYKTLREREEEVGSKRRRWQDGEIRRLERCLKLNLT